MRERLDDSVSEGRHWSIELYEDEGEDLSAKRGIRTRRLRVCLALGRKGLVKSLYQWDGGMYGMEGSFVSLGWMERANVRDVGE